MELLTNDSSKVVIEITILWRIVTEADLLYQHYVEHCPLNQVNFNHGRFGISCSPVFWPVITLADFWISYFMINDYC
jgi:hypothetical protein